MLHLTIALALAAASCCSAFQVQVPDSVLAYQATNPGASGRNLYFPCNAVSAGHMQNLDLSRFGGRWFQVNGAFAVSDKINPADVQQRISTEIGCVKGQFNTSSTSGQIGVVADIITRQPVPANATLPPNAKWINANDIQFTSGAVLERQGDNGLWLLNTNIGNNDALLQDLSIVSTDYTSYAILYTCQDVPVPGTADTKREQQWSIIRRRPRNLSPFELMTMRWLALRNGIVDADNVYTYQTDRCWSPPPTTTTSTTTSTTTPSTTTTTTTTTPTTTPSTTTTTPTTTTTTAPTTTRSSTTTTPITTTTTTPTTTPSTTTTTPTTTTTTAPTTTTSSTTTTPTTTTTTASTTTPSTTTTPTTTTPTTTTTTTTTSPSTSAATAGPELPTNFYQSFVRKVRNFRPF